jgi:hypothetical protein
MVNTRGLSALSIRLKIVFFLFDYQAATFTTGWLKWVALIGKSDVWMSNVAFATRGIRDSSASSPRPCCENCDKHPQLRSYACATESISIHTSLIMSSSIYKSREGQKLDNSVDLLKHYHSRLDVLGYQKLLADLQQEDEARSRSQLCDRYLQLGLDLLIDRKIEEGYYPAPQGFHGHFELEDHFVVQLQDHGKGYRSCPLCHLLLYTLGGNDCSSKPGFDEFGIVEWRCEGDRLRPGQDWKIQTISNLSDGERHISVLSDDSESVWPRRGRILKDQADLELLRGWLGRCTQKTSPGET